MKYNMFPIFNFISVLFICFFLISCTHSDKEDKITNLCYEEWKNRGWTIGKENKPAHKDFSTKMLILNICRARAELYLEGYRINPIVDEGDLKAYILADNKSRYKIMLKSSL